MSVSAGIPRIKALAAALRKAREAAVPKLSVRELARQLGLSHGTVSQWETGKRIPRPEDVARVLTALGVTGDDVERIIDLARGANEPNWLTVGVPGASQQLAGAIECESTAKTITWWEPMLIPGLLQTGDYARSVITLGGVSRTEVETLVHIRMGRRDVLTRREPAHLIALIGEAAIRDRVGSPEVMADQLRHLVEMATQPNITVQIVPSGIGWHPGLVGPFTMFDFPDSPPIVHLEHHRSGVFLSDEGDVEDYRTAATTLRHLSMSPEDAAELIDKTITTLGVTSS